MKSRLTVILILPALWLAACASPRTATTELAEPEAVARPWSEVETWDVPPLNEEAVVASREVQHAVPDSLMRSVADKGLAMERAGFRIQVFSSINRRETIAYEERLLEWLEARSDEDLSDFGIRGADEVYNIFSSPYYRVRLGNFVSRGQATALHNALSRTFPNVLIVPDRVRIVR